MAGRRGRSVRKCPGAPLGLQERRLQDHQDLEVNVVGNSNNYFGNEETLFPDQTWMILQLSRHRVLGYYYRTVAVR